MKVYAVVGNDRRRVWVVAVYESLEMAELHQKKLRHELKLWAARYSRNPPKHSGYRPVYDKTRTWGEYTWNYGEYRVQEVDQHQHLDQYLGHYGD